MKIRQVDVDLGAEEIEQVEALALEAAAKRTVDEGQEITEVVATGCKDSPGYYDIEIRFHSPIRRLRRITGYLSDTARWNDAKKAELAAREGNPHVVAQGGDSDIDDLRYRFR